jgi:hypothetical protein
VAVCVLSKDCLAPTFVRAKQVKYLDENNLMENNPMEPECIILKY